MWLEGDSPMLISQSKYMGNYAIVIGVNGKRYDFKLPASLELEKTLKQFRFAPWVAFNRLKKLNDIEGQIWHEPKTKPKKDTQGRLFEQSSQLQTQILSLRPKMVQAAQAEYNAWNQNEEGVDMDLGGGGICDRISNAISGVLSEAGIDTTDGGQDGDDHAYTIAYNDTEAYGVDIDQHTYEKGGGFNWTKIPGVVFTPNNIEVWPIDRDWIEPNY